VGARAAMRRVFRDAPGRHDHDRGAALLAALTEGYQSAFLACAVLAGIGLALALLLPGRPPKTAHEQPEPVLATGAAAAGDVVIRSGTK
jgi:hypothetical protein